MTLYRPISRLALTVLVLCTCLGTQARDNVHISDLSDTDRQYMTQQRDIMADLAARNFGRKFNGAKANDLDLLQAMLDRRLIPPDQTRELQAMGVIMGDLLAADLDMHWVIYKDRLGRSRALRYRDSENYLFPITMISRRQEADNNTPVAVIYQKAHALIASNKPPLPFQ